MISKEYLENMLKESIENGFHFACDAWCDDEVGCCDFAFEMGRFYGREEVIERLLAEHYRGAI